MRVNWTRTARCHLQAIHDYIAVNSPRQAQRVVDRITQRSKSLAAMPLLGDEVPEYGDESIREILFRSYRIIYRLLPDRIDIISVVHGAQLMPPNPPLPRV